MNWNWSGPTHLAYSWTLTGKSGKLNQFMCEVRWGLRNILHKTGILFSNKPDFFWKEIVSLIFDWWFAMCRVTIVTRAVKVIHRCEKWLNIHKMSILCKILWQFDWQQNLFFFILRRNGPWKMSIYHYRVWIEIFFSSVCHHALIYIILAELLKIWNSTNLLLVHLE